MRLNDRGGSNTSSSIVAADWSGGSCLVSDPGEISSARSLKHYTQFTVSGSAWHLE